MPTIHTDPALLPDATSHRLPESNRIHEQDRGSETDFETEPDRPKIRSHARRSGSGIWLTSLIAIGAIGGVVLLAVGNPFGVGTGTREAQALTHTVQRGKLLITVTEDGNVESASNVEIKCHVAGGSSILWIIGDGETVLTNQEIVRLDSANIEEQLNTQKIAYEKARAAMIQAEEDFAAAKISVQEYVEGTFVKELQLAESQITIALENLRSAENILSHTERMARKGYVTPLQRESQQFAVQRAKLELAAAQTSKNVLEKFTREKMQRELESSRDAAEARMLSERASFELERGRLERLQMQLENCIVKAPQGGMVVYANERSRRGSSGVTIEEGAVVRERQTIVRIPDLKNMQVVVAVHETKVEQIKPGMPARITIQDRELYGTVAFIANQPEPTSYFSADVKEYATIVKIDGEAEGLRPGMTAVVEILVAELNDVLAVPVQAVVEQRGQFYCWVQSPTGPQRKQVLLGMTNDRMIQIKDGLVEGERVLLNPRAIVDDAEDDRERPAQETPAEDDRSPGEADELPAPYDLSASPPAKDSKPKRASTAEDADSQAGAETTGENPQKKRGGRKADVNRPARPDSENAAEPVAGD